MKISYNWLSKYIKTNLPIESITTVLTDAGLEVEGVEKIESIKGSLEGIIVGEVVKCEPHPNADKLKLTQINLGSNKIVQIVCGAPNVKEKQKVPVATLGTILYTESGEAFEIKKTKIRGEESFGMICSEKELGLGKANDGILILNEKYKPGTALNEIYLPSVDYSIEIGLTPNRTDAMSHYGVARDLYASLKNKKIKAELEPLSTNSFSIDENENPFSIEIENEELCPRYSGIYIKNINIKPSPEWLQNSLKAIGLSAINNAVDITNYIMHSYGNPLHAFDADKIKNKKLKIGTCKEGIEFTTLDGITRKLSDKDLVIKDGENTPLCLAGVYGGLDSGVNENTKNIFLESAYFSPTCVRKISKNHGLNTDSSFRMERGIDPNNNIFALKKAAELFKDLAGATIGTIIDEYPKPIARNQTILRYHKIDQILGIRIHRDQIKSILISLDFTILTENNHVLEVEIPSYRVDVTREIDIIEEIVRIYGYNNINIPEKFSFAYENKNHFDEEGLENSIANQLKHIGFNEVLNNSLTKKHSERHDYVELLNALSNDLAVMRQSLVYGILENIEFNFNRGYKEIKFFEFGKTYFKNSNKFIENKKLALALSGNYHTNSWIAPSNNATFYHLKGIVYQLLEGFPININEEAVEKDEVLEDGISLIYQKQIIGKLGIVQTKLTQEFNIKNKVFYAELNWEFISKIAAKKTNLKLNEIPKFPGSNRDLALLLNKDIKYIDLYKKAFETEKKLLKSVQLFDVYEGKNLPEGKKSYALSFFLQNENKTLTDKDVDKVMEKLLEKFSSEFNAELRQN